MSRLPVVLIAAALASVVASCGGGDSSTASDGLAWTEEEVTFSVGPNELYGVLTVPASKGSHAAVVIASGSESQDGSIQSGVSGTYFMHLARRLAGVGYAAFRYDTRGVGRSEGDAGFQDLEAKRDEVIAALHRVQEHPAIRQVDPGARRFYEACACGLAQPPHIDVRLIVTVKPRDEPRQHAGIWRVRDVTDDRDPHA